MSAAYSPAPDRLNMAARITLALAGIDVNSWLRLYPACDVCGCPDDRCSGYHHAALERECACLTAVIAEDLQAGRITRDCD